MFDSILFELQGVPAVPIITEPFIPTALALNDLQAMDDHQFVAVAHPITSLSLGEVRARAIEAAAHVEAILLGRPRPSSAERSHAIGGDDDVAAINPSAERSASEARAEGNVDLAMLDQLIERLAPAIRADGADLTASSDGVGVTFQLHIPDQACAECVLPADLLLPILTKETQSALGPALAVSLNDPRTA